MTEAVDHLQVHHENGSFATKPSTLIDAKLLGVATSENVVIPDNAKYVIFKSTGDFFVDWTGGTATVPGDTTDGSAAELNPSKKYVQHLVNATGFSLISPAAQTVTMSWFRT